MGWAESGIKWVSLRSVMPRGQATSASNGPLKGCLILQGLVCPSEKIFAATGGTVCSAMPSSQAGRAGPSWGSDGTAMRWPVSGSSKPSKGSHPCFPLSPGSPPWSFSRLPSCLCQATVWLGFLLPFRLETVGGHNRHSPRQWQLTPKHPRSQHCGQGRASLAVLPVSEPR